ncbi:MAG: arginine--tRNA ligase [bacterium]|nr:arginine--tRNA ligase [bacterium]
MIDYIKSLLTKVIGSDAEIKITFSEKTEFGDYTTNIAFDLAKKTNQSPLETANELSQKIKEADNDNCFSRIGVAKPGFINLWISPDFLIKQLSKILDLGPEYGESKTSNPKNIQIEFVSANPTGPLTMANGRGGFLGSTLANVMEKIGHKVTREYYINDTGHQVELLGNSVLAKLGLNEPAEDHYQGDYIQTLADYFKNSADDIKGTNGRIVADYLFKELIQPSLKKAGLEFDNWFSEYENLHQKKELQKVLELLAKQNLIDRYDGAQWLKTTDIEDEKSRVLVKSDGQPTYFLSDIAYHYDKLIKRGFDLVIDIWGADHHGYVARLKSGVKAVGANPEKLKIIIIQLVRLMRGEQEIRMSKRSGQFITMDNLIDEVGKDAARFFFLMYSPDTHMNFDLVLAKEKSLKNPVYYCQYAFARANSILIKAGSQKTTTENIGLLTNVNELNLIKALIKWPDILQQTAEDYQVNRLTRYALEVSKTFHNFYEKERVVDNDPKITSARLAIVLATKTILKNIFDVLGISAPEKM